ncbi:pitrilysin family protein [Sphingomonas sp. AOB5]|uniref:M16 family metallopeptidase n=1 Tax=Sphingomonas sp. AOB5 TaxID=3034017 RepID=UPI0023F83639|nr:pitrilysin family protein [Sphingomonas sp. AOB5]MDF7775102.1 pitrilysin family protein [Sphingomonas sp. AOB5]
MKSFLLFGAATCALAISAPAFAQNAAAPAAPAQAAAPAAKPAPVSELAKSVDIPYEEFTLSNGLRVIVHTDRKAPIVAVSTWYDVGAKHEPKGKTGFAHLFEHLMFNGSENAPGDFFEPLRQVGATDFNGTTSFDRTNYFETVPTPALERALFLESDRMGYLLGAIDQAVLDEQRGVVQNEKRQNDNNPYGLAFYRIVENVFPEGHPYAHLPIGSMADLDAASIDDVKNWFKSHYGPNNAVLVLAGDIDVATARPLVEKYFGGIPRGPETHLPNAPVVPLAAPKTETMKDRVATTRVYRVWAVPGLNDPDAVPLDVFASVLGGLSSSRLDNALVRKEKLAVNVSSGIQSLSQGGMFLVVLDVRPGVDPAVAVKRLDEIMADLLKNGPTADEVTRVATNNISGRIAGLESVGGFGGKAVALASGALYSNDPGFYKKQLNRLATTTPAQVRAAAGRWLGKPSYTLTVEPGAREGAYAEAAKPAAKPAEAAAPKTEVSMNTRAEKLPDVGNIGDLDFPDVQRAKLSNGVEVIYAQRKAAPITQVVISFDAGVVADPDGKLGLQSLALSVMDEGTTHLDSIQIAEAKERLGARIGTGNSADRTYVTLFTPSPNLGGSLDLLGDVVKNPAFAPAEVERVRGQVLAGIQQELTSPQGLAQRTTPKVLYGNSPYAKLAAGSGDPEAIKTLTREDLVGFHQAWIRPEKAKIFVVSDRPLAEVTAALEARFGKWQGTGTAGVKALDVAPTQSSPKIVLVDRPQSPQSLIIGAQLTPLVSTADLLDVLTANEVLGSGFLSRINMNLRENKHWSYGVRGGFSRYEGTVPYIISAPVQADKTGASITELRNDVRNFLTTQGITPAEFERTINGETRELPGTFETSGSVLSAMQSNDMFKRPDNYYDTIAARYRAMKSPQLDAAARAAIDPDKFVWIVVGDASVVRPQLEGLGLPIEVVPSPAPAAPAPAKK